MAEDLISPEYIKDGILVEKKPPQKESPKEGESYKANPNQFTYDIPHIKDFTIQVMDVFFGKPVPKYDWLPQQSTYTIKSKGTIQDVVNAKEKELKKAGKEIQKLEGKGETEQKENYTKGDNIILTWEERKQNGYDFEKINTANLGDTVYLVVKYIGQGGKLKITLHENVNTPQNRIFAEPFKFLEETEEKTEVLFPLQSEAYQYKKIQLRPKSDEELKSLKEKLKTKEGKNAFIYLTAKVIDTKDTVNYLGLGVFQNPYLDKDGKLVADYLKDGKGKFEIKLKSPTIVIDPGHGVTPGNEGAQARIYEYMLQGTDGKVLKDAKSNAQTKTANVIDLPQYVLDNPSTWIIGDNDYKVSKNNKLDPNRTENYMVYDTAGKMEKLLVEKGYKVINTRKAREVTKVSDSKEAIYFRTTIANNNKADYFISIHADGANNFASGSHVIYNKGDEDGKELAKDIFSNYTVVAIEAKHPSAREDVGVVGSKNNTKRKVLIELGYITSPSDANKIYSNMDLVAEQLVQGLEKNINKNF